MPRTAEWQRVVSHERRERLKAAGYCATCGKRRPKPGRVTCVACLTYLGRYNSRRRQWRITAGLCYLCGVQVEDRRRCGACRAKGRAYHRDYLRRLAGA